jgi:hypothetical protein
VSDEEDFAERLGLLRDHVAEEEIEEIVRWQMTGILTKKAPMVKHQEQPLCHRCRGDWHGLPKDECPGSFTYRHELDHSYDTPDKDKQ